MTFIIFAQETTGEGVLDAGQRIADVGKEMSDKVAGVGQNTWDKIVSQTTELVGGYAPNALAALIVLIVGWIVALIIAAVVRAAARRLGVDKRFAESVATGASRDGTKISSKIGKAVFYLIMLFVLVAFFQTLGLTIVTEPLTTFLNQVFEYAPRLIAAGILLFLAWMVALAVRFIVTKVLTTAKLDRWLTRRSGVDSDEDLPLTKTISEASYWLVLLLFLPAVLDALAVPGLLAPVQGMVTKILGFLPNVFAAAVILGIGWLVARIVQRIVSNLLAAAGTDKLSERAGLSQIMGDKKLSDVLGLLVYILILVPVIIASLNALKIDAVTQPASQMLNQILGVLPGIIAAALVIAVAYVVGRVVSGMAGNLLAGMGFNKLPARLGLATEPFEGRRTPSQIAAAVIMIAIVLFATMQALPMLGFDLLASMMSEFLTFATQVLLGLVIFAFGLYFARLVADLISDSSITNARLLSTIARVAILVLAGAMGLQQMGLAEEIVNLAFGITLGAVAVAAAIAFGIGGRDAAKKVVDDLVKSRSSRKG